DAQQLIARTVVDEDAAQVALDQVHDRGAGELGLLDVVDRVAADARGVEDLQHGDHQAAHDQQHDQHLHQGEAPAGRCTMDGFGARHGLESCGVEPGASVLDEDDLESVVSSSGCTCFQGSQRSSLSWFFSGSSLVPGNVILICTFSYGCSVPASSSSSAVLRSSSV